MKVDKEQWQMIIALVLVAVVAASLLATTDIFTREPIAQAQREALRKALLQVLPEHVNDAQTDVIRLGKDKQQIKIYPARNAAKDVVGLAWEVIAPDGYSGTIKILVGVRPERTVHAIRITFHRETPGLGDGIVNDADWLGAFVGKSLEGTRWAVKKDGGEFDQFTGATITPRAVVKAVKGALEYYKVNQKLIADAITAQDAKPEPVADVKQGANSRPAPEVANKTAAKKTPEVANKTAAKKTPEVAKKIVSKAAPKPAAKPAPKISPEAAKNAAPKAVAEPATKLAPKTNSEAAKKAVSETVPQSVPIISSEAAKKAVSETVPQSVPENIPSAAAKTAPLAEDISPAKQAGDGGGQ